MTSEAETFIDDNWYRLDPEERDEYRARERKAMTPEVLHARNLETYATKHQALVHRIRAEAVMDVRARLEIHDQVDLGRRLVAWLINREVDRRTLARLPGDAYGSLMYSGSLDARGAWHYDRELQALNETIFPESKPKPMTLTYEEPRE